MIRILSVAIIAATSVWISGCTTMTAPALRHETGETLGPKRVRVQGRMERSRIFALLPPGSSSAGIEQPNSTFQGTLLGVHGTVGAAPRVDLLLGAFFSSGGGGWRLAGKYQFLGEPGKARTQGALAASAMVGYAAYSGSGKVQYLTSTLPNEAPQSLSARTVELSVPISYRLTPDIVPYTGLTLYHNIVSGSVDSVAVSEVVRDLGWNLGMRFVFGVVEVDLEFAMLKINDPFANASRFIPFFGVAGGVTF